MSPSLDRKRYLTRSAVQLAKRKTADIELRTPNKEKIIDLNMDCVEHILKYLYINDLLHVADSRKSLNDAVKHAFKSKYKKHVSIGIDFGARIEVQMKNGHNEKHFTFGTILKFLRCFGELITTVDIVFCLDVYGNKDKINEFWHYMSEYCSETLTELHIIFF